MFRKSTILALTAFAALGLAISNASAKPGKPGPGNQMPGNGGPGIIKPISQIKPIKIIPTNPIKPGKPGVNWPLYPKPVYHPIYKPVPVVVSQPVYVAARPVVATPGPCTCRQGVHAGGRGAVQGPLHHRDGDEPAAGCAVTREVDEESPGAAPGFLLLRGFQKT